MTFPSTSGRTLALAVLAATWLMSACAPEKLRVPAARVAVPKASAPEQATAGQAVTGDAIRSEAVAASAGSGESAADRKIELISGTPAPIDLPPRPDPTSRLSSANSLTAAVEGMPARNFVNYVFGELLKVNYILVDGTPGLDDPITFNVQKPVSSRQLFKLVGELLASRGISIVEKEGTYFIGPANAKTQQGLPIGYGRNPADVPDLPGEIFQIVPLRFAPTQTLIDAANRFTSLSLVGPEISWDAFFVRGPRSEILKFLDLVRLFDRPSVKGSRIGLLSLTYIGPDEFLSQVSALLANEGIGVGGSSPLNMVSLDRLGAIVAFSSSDAVLERLEFWAQQLDRPGQGPTQRYFVYQPRFARAADIGESLAGLLGVGGSALGNQSRDTRSALGASSSNAVATADTVMRRDAATGGAVGGSQGVGTVSGDGVTLSIDTRSNSLIFYTTGPRYEALLPMIRRLDIPPKQIVLEAMIAEVNLTGEFQNGVEFAFREGKLSGGTAGNLGLPTGGLALTYDFGIGEQIRMRLQASDARVNVLSNPILVVKDGVAASIQVGNDVPTVGATASDPIQSDRLVTTVLYRNTGLNLSITPNINAQGSVLLSISQSTTNAVPGSSGVSGAPIFFQRSVSTEVVAASGQTVFLAGLRSESDSTTSSKVPVLGSVPLLGSLFSSDTRRREKTELVILITPRIVEDLSEWREVMNGLGRSMQLLTLPTEGAFNDATASPSEIE